jgi:hypothetical protein
VSKHKLQTEERIRFERCEHRWKNNIKVDVKEIEWECVGCIDLTQVSYKCKVFVNTVSKKYGEFL